MTTDFQQADWQSPDGQSSLQCRDGLALLGAMSDDSVDCIWTDPPYFLSNDGITCVAGKQVSVNKGEWDRGDDLDAVYEFNRMWLAECHRVLKPGRHHLGDWYAPRLPQRRYGDDAAGVSHPQRHHLGEKQPAAPTWAVAALPIPRRPSCGPPKRPRVAGTGTLSITRR